MHNLKDVPYEVRNPRKQGPWCHELLALMVNARDSHRHACCVSSYFLPSSWFPHLNITSNGNTTLRISTTGLERGTACRVLK
ncbi:unnamed protein product [Penicillium camemberti]|uniref:Str. FM013 n=1 Tax=Penicillium camemberti (strain FM 013) TaxID=1429867 RepID=A0A0G4P2B4_PENC3|nr:unnamed protein product [Penicillium camemberti]